MALAAGARMSTIDLDALLLEIEPDAPSGPNLEYDPAFVALEQEALGKPEVQYGKTITPAVPPDWKQVRRMAGDLLARSRDLRLAVHLLRAELALSGMAGLADALALIARLLDQHWDTVHPELDRDDGDDPTLRINSLALLGDATLIRDLKDATLVVMPGFGPLTMRVLEIANGELPPLAGQEKLALASIEKAIADIEPLQLSASAAALTRALGAAVDIEVVLVRRVGSAQALNLDPLVRPLRRAHEFLARYVQQDAPAADAEGRLDVHVGSNPATPDGAVMPARGISGDIASRDDVVRMLDKLLQYYTSHEPSSPIPILIERARRLVPMTFMEVLDEMVPGGTAQIAVIRGPGAG
jgi:type VI secretion system protein ImpA